MNYSDPNGCISDGWKRALKIALGVAIIAAEVVLTIVTEGAAANLLITTLVSATTSTLFGGLSFADDEVSWDWDGAIDGFMWGSIGGAISGSISYGANSLCFMSNFGKKVFFSLSNTMVNVAINGVKSINNKNVKYMLASFTTSFAFGIIGGLSAATLAEGFECSMYELIDLIL